MTIDDITVDIIAKLNGPIETRLAEAIAIEKYRPSSNRKHELTDW